jgi:hypothetical protein
VLKRLMLSASLMALAAAGLPTIAAQAQGASSASNKNVAVMDRVRPDYEPKGINAGGFMLRPSLEVVAEQTDNVFATQRNERDDLILSLRPRIDVESNWTRHAFRGSIGADTNSHQDFDSEDRTNFDVGGDLRLEIQRDSEIRLRGRFDRITDPRTALDSRNIGAEPVQYDRTSAGVSVGHTFNRLRVIGSVDFNQLEYENLRDTTGAVLNQQQRNRDEFAYGVRAEYALSPDTRLVGEAELNKRDYDLQPPRVLETRDSEGQEYRVGVSSDFAQVWRGEVTVGYFEQKYDSARIGDVNGLALRGRLQWFPTQLTTVSFTGDRGSQETDIGQVGAAIATSFGAGVDHELRRNIIVSGAVRTERLDFQGVDREDEGFSVRLGGEYLLNRNVGVFGGYRYTDVESTGALRDRDFKENRFTVGLRLKL